MHTEANQVVTLWEGQLNFLPINDGALTLSPSEDGQQRRSLAGPEPFAALIAGQVPALLESASEPTNTASCRVPHEATRLRETDTASLVTASSRPDESSSRHRSAELQPATCADRHRPMSGDAPDFLPLTVVSFTPCGIRCNTPYILNPRSSRWPAIL